MISMIKDHIRRYLVLGFIVSYLVGYWLYFIYFKTIEVIGIKYYGTCMSESGCFPCTGYNIESFRETDFYITIIMVFSPPHLYLLYLIGAAIWRYKKRLSRQELPKPSFMLLVFYAIVGGFLLDVHGLAVLTLLGWAPANWPADLLFAYLLVFTIFGPAFIVFITVTYEYVKERRAR